MTEPVPKLRWFQCSLRTLLIILTLSAIPFGWIAITMRRAERDALAAHIEAVKAKRERDAATALEKLGAEVEWSAPNAQKGPSVHVTAVRREVVDDADTTWNPVDADLTHLRELTELETLNLYGADKVTSAGLENIKELKMLRELDITFLKLTERDLAMISGLENLRVLKLNECYWLTDAGVDNLKALTHLQLLEIGPVGHKGSKGLSTDGIGLLQRALPHCKIACYGAP